MRFTRALLFGLAVLFFSLSAAKADSVSGNGTWGDVACLDPSNPSPGCTPVTPESAPGASWSFSFLVSDPATDAVPSGGGFQTQQVSGLVYLLNGVPVPVTLVSADFFDALDLGLFDLNLSDGETVSFFGAQVFGGSPPPIMTFIPGVYPAGISMNGADPSGNGTVTITSTSISVPEPSTLSLLSLALFGLLLIRISKD